MTTSEWQRRFLDLQETFKHSVLATLSEKALPDLATEPTQIDSWSDFER